MSLQWTGERLITELDNAFGTFEHLHRYALAVQLCHTKIVLDLASGEGYGSNLIANVATSVIGVDISGEVIEHAKKKYQRKNLQFKRGSGSAIPMEPNSVDVIVSFETIEHLKEQEIFLSEIKRVLKKDGILIISTPDKETYSQRDANNPFHVKELTTEEFQTLIGSYFNKTQLFQQRIFIGSVISQLKPKIGAYSFFDGDFLEIKTDFNEYDFFNKVFFNLIVASDNELKDEKIPSISLFSAYKTYQSERETLLQQSLASAHKLNYLFSSPAFKFYIRIVDLIKLPARLIKRINRNAK